MKRLVAISACLLVLLLASAAKSAKPASKKSPAGPAPDKALADKIWQGWSTLDPANTAKLCQRAPYFLRHRPIKIRQLGRI
jgi:hypothetical protein